MNIKTEWTFFVCFTSSTTSTKRKCNRTFRGWCSYVFYVWFCSPSLPIKSFWSRKLLLEIDIENWKCCYKCRDRSRYRLAVSYMRSDYFSANCARFSIFLLFSSTNLPFGMDNSKYWLFCPKWIAYARRTGTLGTLDTNSNPVKDIMCLLCFFPLSVRGMRLQMKSRTFFFTHTHIIYFERK